MKKGRANIFIGFTIGLLAALLLAALAILFVPRLRPIVGLNGTTVMNTTINATANTAAVNTSENKENKVPVRVESENIYVSSPAPDTKISNPFLVSGSARVFENIVNIRLKDGDNSVLAESFATAQSADVGLFGNFELNLTYKQPRFATGTLEVYWQSAKDGSDQDLVSIPVEFAAE